MRQIRTECFLQFVEILISDENPHQKLEDLAEILKDGIYELQPSSKYMSGRTFVRLEPTPSLKYKNSGIAFFIQTFNNLRIELKGGGRQKL